MTHGTDDSLIEAIEECDWYISSFSSNEHMTPELKLTLIRAILQRKNELQAIERKGNYSEDAAKN